MYSLHLPLANGQGPTTPVPTTQPLANGQGPTTPVPATQPLPNSDQVPAVRAAQSLANINAAPGQAPVTAPATQPLPSATHPPVVEPTQQNQPRKLAELEEEGAGIPEDEFEKLMDALDEDAAAADADAMNIDKEGVVEIPEAGFKRHFPDVWEKLSAEQCQALITKATRAWNTFIKYNRPLGEQIRCWAQWHADFLPQAGSHSLMMAASLFILGNGRTVCHYHTVYNRGQNPINNINPGTRNEKLEVEVTGVPYQTKPDAICSYDTLLLSPDSNLPPRAKNPNFTLKNVLAFFPKQDGFCVLHCGCELEPTLLDLYFWKTMKIKSISTEKAERLGRPMKPRDRAFLCHVLDYLCVDIRSLYSIDVKGSPSSCIDQRKDHIRELLKSVQEMEAEAKREEERAREQAGHQDEALYRELAAVEIVDINSDSDA
ncbi:hypothetical protein H1R20_g1074, partial [Candolleomyces eurysporus]